MHHTQMVKGILEGCVLKIVSKSSLYSQEIVAELKKYGFDTISEGTLFPLLLRLDKEGLFDTKKVATSLGPSRKYYRLNEQGQQELALFLTEWRALKQHVDAVMEG